MDNSLFFKNKELCSDWHPMKNGDLTPEKVTFGTTQSVWWLCHSCQHVWQENVNRRFHGAPCPSCKQRKSEEMNSKYLFEMKEYAKEKGGVCLSNRYRNAHQKLEFECKEGHRFSVNPNKIRSYGAWCKKCWYKLSADKRRGSIEVMKSIAKQREGRCLSDTYLNARSHLKWECKKGHTWKATPDSIKNKNSWCPKCNSFVNEEKCRFILQSLTGKSFPKVRSILNNAYELDGYNHELMIGFEYHGKQHFQYNKWWHNSKDDFNKRVRDDERKMDLCQRMGIGLIVIPYYLETDIQKIVHIKDELSHHEVALSNSSIDMKAFQQNIQMLERYDSIARSKGGRCLSNIFQTSHTPLEWECDKGHKWFAEPTNIQIGKWCRRCYDEINSQKGIVRDITGYGIENSLKIKNPMLASEWHPTKNGILKPEQFLVSSEKEVWWLGKCGHEFKGKIRARHRKKSCRVCSGKIVVLENCLATKYPELAKEWNKQKNGNITPYDVTSGMRRKVWWKCLTCGYEWEDFLYNRVDVPSRKGRGCLNCKKTPLRFQED
jgi:hypothetical protein